MERSGGLSRKVGEVIVKPYVQTGAGRRAEILQKQLAFAVREYDGERK